MEHARLDPADWPRLAAVPAESFGAPMDGWERGYLDAGTLRRIGRLDGDDADVDAATALLAGPTPWMPDFF